MLTVFPEEKELLISQTEPMMRIMNWMTKKPLIEGEVMKTFLICVQFLAGYVDIVDDCDVFKIGIDMKMMTPLDLFVYTNI